MADIIEELVLDFSGRGSTETYASSTNAWDCSIGTLPFLFAFSQQNPGRRQTAQFRTDRVDQEREPGEQSLDSGVWHRSQTSYHYGAGQVSQEPLETSADIARFRYERSAGVDVWTPGKATLLNATLKRVDDGGSTQLALGLSTGVLFASGTSLKYVTEAGAATSMTYAGGAIQSITTDGNLWYTGSASGIYAGALPSGSGSLLYNTAARTTVRYVKARLMAAVGPSLYEIVGATPPTLPAAMYTHPSSTWIWTDIAEGPAAIYASGYNSAGGTSSIYAITTKADVTGLNPPVQVVEIPRGETVNTLYGYLGEFLGVGTSKGLRIASLDADGNLQLGPLVFECAGGVKDMVGLGSYLYVSGGSDVPNGSASTGPGLYRVDLSTDLGGGAFAYAPDLTGGPSGTTRCATTTGTSIWFTVDTQGLYQQDLAHFVTSGWLQPGMIRYATVAPKAWRTLRMLGPCPAGTSVSAYVDTEGDGDPAAWYALGSLDSTAAEISLSLSTAAPGTQTALFTAYQLSSNPSRDASPVWDAYELRAVPMPIRNRLIQLPLLCFDYERAKTGMKVGKLGGAWERLKALELLEETAGTITYTDYTTGEKIPVTIEEVAFLRQTPPTAQSSGSGGVIMLTLRTAH